MAAVGSVGPAIAQPIQPLPHDNRTSDIAKPIFQRFKETALRVWNFLVVVVKEVGGKVNFVFFRVLEWVHPTWALKAEVAFLRISQAVQDTWNGQQNAQQADEFRVQNQNLRLRVRHLEGIEQLNANLTQERNDLRDENQRLTAATNFVNQRIQGVLQQHQLQTQQVDAINTDRDLLLQQADLLRQQQNRLTAAHDQLVLQRDEARAAQQAALAAHNQLQQQTAQLQQQIPLLRAQLNAARMNQQVAERFQQALDASKQMLLRPNDQKTQLDDFLETLLHQLLDNIDAVRQEIQTRPNPSLAQQAADQAIDQNLDQLIRGLRQFPVLFTQHRDYQNSLQTLLRDLMPPQEV